MFNKIALTTLAVSSFAVPAIAGPYVNVETSSKFAGTDYSKTATDFFVGYEGEVGTLDYFIEGGPSVTTPDDGVSETVPAGKVGFSVKANKHLKVYAGNWLLVLKKDGRRLGYGTKAGVKYSF